MNQRAWSSRFFRIVGVLWLFVSLTLCVLSVYAYVNAGVSYKYVVEEWSETTMPESLIVRARWIEEQQTESKYLAGYFALNTIWIGWVLARTWRRGSTRNDTHTVS